MNVIFLLRWLPVSIYWLLILVIKFEKNRRNYAYHLVLLEAAVSIFMAMLQDRFVYSRLLTDGIGVIDSSNIAFQFAVMVFYAILQVIVTGFSIKYERAQDKTQDRVQVRAQEPSDSKNEKDIEKWMYDKIRTFGPLLPDRYQQDRLLKEVFFQ